MKYDIRKFIKPDEDAADETLAFIEASGDGIMTDTTVTSSLTGAVAEGMSDEVEALGARHTDEEETAARRDRVVARVLDKEIVSKAHIREAYKQWKRKGERDTLWRWVASHPEVDGEAVFAEASRIYAFRPAEIGSGKPDTAFVKRVVDSFDAEQRDELIALKLLPLEHEIDAERGMLRLVFAAQDPGSPDILRFASRLGLDLFELRYAPESQITPLLRKIFPTRNEYLERMHQERWAYDLGASFEQKQEKLVDEEAIEEEINRSSLINLVEASLVEAVRLGASDIHVFPNAERQTEFLMRVDGELVQWHVEDKVHPEALLAVIKDRSGSVDRFEREAAQDGFIQRSVDGALIRYRVSVLPIATANSEIRAESIVIRVLDDRNVFADLSAIGLLPGATERFRKAIKQPYGMVIMTGPTGSGKSTTLVAALHHVIRPQINVLSIEDPVEYVIRGVRQIKLGTRLNMEGALRSVLRHDPDVVMVGEMRDRQTAELAVKLANTGHVTFSTLHTNDAPSAVSRLFKMGIEPFLIAYAINLIVAQRLLRTLCKECKTPDPEPDPVLLHEIGFTDEEIAATTFYRAGENDTCSVCHGVGYLGRQAIAEALYFTRDIRHLIVKARGDIDEDALRNKAIEEGMLTLLASGREIVKRGHTSIDEVMRVTSSDD